MVVCFWLQHKINETIRKIFLLWFKIFSGLKVKKVKFENIE
tara:strand:- start:3702 stop:3824 length:123 start_codon:yes stop_codon:yes gene_type:complete